MRKKTRPNSPGFTVIEILIVLAIAGLILLLVFLIVPALQRSARNTRRKHDAAYIADARQQHDLDGPSSSTAPNSIRTCAPPITDGSICSYIVPILSYYDPSNVTIVYNNNLTPGLPTVVTDPEKIMTVTHLVCDPTTTSGTPVGAKQLDTVILFATESGGSVASQCIQTNVFNNDS